MKRVAVKSSNIKSIGYDADTETLEVAFNSGSVYRYFNVPAQLHKRLMSAESKGGFFNINIKNNSSYPYRKVE